MVPQTLLWTLSSCEAALHGVKCPLSGWAGSAGWPAPAGKRQVGQGLRTSLTAALGCRQLPMGGMSSSSPRSPRGRQRERCCRSSWAVTGRSVISPWQGLRMLFGSVLGLSGLGQVSAERRSDQAVNAPWCGAGLGADTDALDLGGCRRGQSGQHLGFQPLRVCSCHSCHQFLWWVEGQADGGAFGGCSATSHRVPVGESSSWGRGAARECCFPKLAGLPRGFPSSDSSRSCGGRMKLPPYQVLSAVKKGSIDVLIDLANGARKLKVIRNDPRDFRTGSSYGDCSWPCCAPVPSCVLFLYPLLHEHHILVGILRQRICELFLVVVVWGGFLFVCLSFLGFFLISS